jgi:hypothetical protein
VIYKEKHDERDSRPLTLRGKVLIAQTCKLKDTCWRFVGPSCSSYTYMAKLGLFVVGCCSRKHGQWGRVLAQCVAKELGSQGGCEPRWPAFDIQRVAGKRFPSYLSVGPLS